MMKIVLQSILITFLLFLNLDSKAQISSQIMDARIDWTPSGGQYKGQLTVYLTDTLGLAGINILISASHPDDSDLYRANYTIGFGGDFYSNGTSKDNVLQTNIGTFSSHPNYYAKISILLINGMKNQIAIHSSN